MELIGMLDSPYVRRVAICLKLLRIDFTHRPVSVFRHFDAFRAINPVVKAPTLVLDDGQMLMDSTLILEYVTALSDPDHTLMPVDAATRLRAIRLTGLALAACEKTVQIVYERNLRPAEKQHQPWVDRVSGQLLAACALLEADLAAAPLPTQADQIDQAGVTLAVTWQFMRMMLPEIVDDSAYPTLRAYADYAEQLPSFVSTQPV